MANEQTETTSAQRSYGSIHLLEDELCWMTAALTSSQLCRAPTAGVNSGAGGDT